MTLQELYAALEEADKRAQAGDAEAQADAVELASMIEQYKESSSPTKADADYVEPIYIAAGTGILGGAKGLKDAIPTAQNIADAMTPPASSTPSKSPLKFNPRGVSVDQSVENWRNYADAQNEAAKGVRRDSALAKKYPNFQRSPLPMGDEALEARNAARQKINKGVEFSGRLLNKTPGANVVGGAMAGYQGADAYNRFQEGDVVGGTVSGVGSAGSTAATLMGKSNPRLKALGLATGVVAPLINRGIDKLRGEPEQKAAGGVVGYAKGKAVKGGLEAVKKLVPAAGNARQLVEPTAEEIAKFVPKPTKQTKFSDAIQNHMDEYLGIHQSDRLGTHGDYMGGTGFPNFQNVNPLHAKNEVVWMNNDPNASNKLIKNTKINDKDVIWTNYIGKENQHKSNRGVFNEVLADVYKNNPDITEEQALKIAERMRTLIGKDLDIRDKFMMQEIGGDTFDSRGKLADMFGLGFGRGKDKLVLSPNYQNILEASSEEFTRGAPTSAIGTRLHKIYDEPSQYSTAFHPDYDYTVHGKDMGVQFPAVPHTILDWTQKYIKEGRGGKGSKIPHGNAWFNYMSDPQHITEEFVKRAQSEGFAEGGEVKGYAGGSAVKKAVQSGLGFLKPSAKSHSQDPEVARALEAYLKGDISQAERIAIMNKQLPLRPWTEMPPAYTDEQIRMALMENKRPKALADVPVGARVGNRLDIPAYTQHGVYVDTTHDLAKGNSPISYNRTGHLKDVEFSSKPNQAVRVGLGTKEQALTPMGAEMGSAKSPFALIKGTNVGTSDEEVRRMMAEMMKDPSYAQIGMDPRRHSQFYDKSTGMPVWAAEEKLQSGPLILVPKRGLETTSWDDPRLNLSDFEGKKYAEGGSTSPAWQRKEGKNPEGGLNAAGRASYNRETGGNLKAPQPEGGPRKKSFCARMEGMKKKNTSSATAKDPDSRINKSLRKWKC